VALLQSLTALWVGNQKASTGAPGLQGLADEWGKFDSDLSLGQTRQMAAWEARSKQSETFIKTCHNIAATDPDATLEQVEEQASDVLYSANLGHG